MNTLKNALTATVLAGVFSAGAVSAPAHAAGKENSGNDKFFLTYSAEQTSSATAEVDQNSGMVVRPHQTEHYAVTNLSYVDQHGMTDAFAVTDVDGDLYVTNDVYQEVVNSAHVTQGTIRVLPHSTLYYDGVNTSYIVQYAENTATIDTKAHGNLRSKNVVKQKASNTAYVEQGTVKALPHSTVYYGGVNTSYIVQYAENTATTVTEAGGTVDAQETVDQETSNTAHVEQGVVQQFRNSTVHDLGSNTSVVLQAEGSTQS